MKAVASGPRPEGQGGVATGRVRACSSPGVGPRVAVLHPAFLSSALGSSSHSRACGQRHV